LLCKRHDFGYVGHENTALQLQLRASIADLGASRSSLVFLVLRLGCRGLLTAEQDVLEKIDFILEKAHGLATHCRRSKGNGQERKISTYILLLVSAAGHDCVDAMKQEVAKLLDTVASPIVNPYFEILHRLVEEIAVYSLVGLGKNSFGGFNTKSQVLLNDFIF